MPDALWLIGYLAGPLFLLGMVAETSARALGLGSAVQAIRRLWTDHLSARRNHYWLEGYRGGYADAQRAARLERDQLVREHEGLLATRTTQAYAIGFDEGRRLATMRAISTRVGPERWN